GLIFTPLWAMAIGRFGFATAALFMGMAALAVLWPVSARYLRAEPGVAGGAFLARKRLLPFPLACPFAHPAYLKFRRHQLSRTTECTGRSVRNRLNGLRRGTAPIEASSENSQT